VTFSPDGKTLAVGVIDDGIHLWDVSGPTPRERLASPKAHKGDLGQLAFAPDGKTLASCGQDGTIRLWDLTSDKPRERAVIQDRARQLISFDCVAFAPDGKSLAAGGNDKRVRLWAMTRETPRECLALAGPRDKIRSVAFTLDAAKLAIGTSEDTFLCDVADGRLQIRHTLFEACSPALFTQDGKRLFTGGKAPHCWDLSAGLPRLMHPRNPQAK